MEITETKITPIDSNISHYDIYGKLSELDGMIDEQKIQFNNTTDEFNKTFDIIDEQICSIQKFNSKAAKAIKINSKNIEINYENIINIDKELTRTISLIERINRFAIRLYDIFKMVLTAFIAFSTVGMLSLVYLMHTNHHTVMVVLILATFGYIMYKLYFAYTKLCKLISSHTKIAFHYK